MRVTVVDSGVGNIPNAVRGLTRCGAEVTLSVDPAAVAAAERIVLPGVGAFPAAMRRLRELGLDRALRDAAERGVPLLGICLGHQLLFGESHEFDHTEGLGLLGGRVVPLAPVARVPHTGWARIEPVREDELLTGLGPGPWMYFVHSYVAEPASQDVIAEVGFGPLRVCAAVRRANICGVQFHPEKSGAAGARMIENFLERVG